MTLKMLFQSNLCLVCWMLLFSFGFANSQPLEAAATAAPFVRGRCHGRGDVIDTQEIGRVVATELPSNLNANGIVWADFDGACEFYCGRGSEAMSLAQSAASLRQVSTFCSNRCTCDSVSSSQENKRRRILSESSLQLFAECKETSLHVDPKAAKPFDALNALSDIQDKILDECTSEECMLHSCQLAGHSANQLSSRSAGMNSRSNGTPSSSSQGPDNSVSFYHVKVKPSSNSAAFQTWMKDTCKQHAFLSISYVPGTSVVLEVYASAAEVEKVRAREEVEYVVQKLPVFKLSASVATFLDEQFAAHANGAGTGGEKLIARLSYQPGVGEELHQSLNAKFQSTLGIANAIQMEDTPAPSSGPFIGRRHVLINPSAVSNPVFLKEILSELLSRPEVRDVQPARASVERHAHKLEFLNLRQSLPPSPVSPHPYRRLDEYSSAVMKMDLAYKRGMTGKGVVVGVADSGLYGYHDQFSPEDGQSVPFDEVDLSQRKVVSYVQYSGNGVDEEECGHGTFVSSIAVGNGYKYQNHTGIAYDAKISFMDIGDASSSSLTTPSTMEELFGPHMKAEAKIVSFSWGGPSAMYSTDTMEMDAFLYSHPEIFMLVSAGNDGDGRSPSNKTYKKNCGGGSIGFPADNKNGFSIGASGNAKELFGDVYNCSILDENILAAFSSIGPAPDGRRKPDVTCPGVTIKSAMSPRAAAGRFPQPYAELCSMQGTSQSAPACAGFAAVVHEGLRMGTLSPHSSATSAYKLSSSTITSALLRAILLFSTSPLTGWMPNPSTAISADDCSYYKAAMRPTVQGDNMQGFGRVNMDNLLTNSSTASQLFFFPNAASPSPYLSVGQTQNFSVRNFPANMSFRAVLTWTDPPSAAGNTCKQVLVNDLDLLVEELDGGNRVIAKFSPLGVLQGTTDNLNNNEMVVVPASPSASSDSYRNFRVVVAATQIRVGGDQAYAIAFSRGIESATTLDEDPASADPNSVSSSPVGSLSDSGTSAAWPTWKIVVVSVSAAVGAIAVSALLFVIYRRWSERREIAWRAKAQEEPVTTPTEGGLSSRNTPWLPWQNYSRYRDTEPSTIFV